MFMLIVGLFRTSRRISITLNIAALPCHRVSASASVKPAILLRNFIARHNCRMQLRMLQLQQIA